MNNTGVGNLHSLLSGHWFIEANYQQALLPYLGAILNGTPVPEMTHHPILFMNGGGEEIKEDSTEESLVAILPIKSPIFKYDQNCGPIGTQSMMAQMRLWANDARIKGVVLDIDSGGGQVVGTPEYAAFIASYQKPVVVYSDGTLCSAAFYIAAGADEIILSEHANNIGSIGTMFSSLDVTKKLKKEGISIVQLYADKSTKKNKVGRSFKEGDFTPLIKEVLNPINEKFIATMLAFRPQLNTEVFTGADYMDLDQAKNYGLFDSYGTLNGAIARVIELSNNKNSKKPKQMNKTYTKINALLGEGNEVNLKSGLFSSGKGAKLSEEQLDAIETRLNTLEAENATLVSENATVQTLKTQAENAKNEQKALEDAVEAAAIEAEIEAKDSSLETIAALSAEIVRLGKQPGAMGTQAVAPAEDDDDTPEHVDPNALHNQIKEF